MTKNQAFIVFSVISVLLIFAGFFVPLNDYNRAPICIAMVTFASAAIWLVLLFVYENPFNFKFKEGKLCSKTGQSRRA